MGRTRCECVDLLMGCQVVLTGDRDQRILFDEDTYSPSDNDRPVFWTRNELESILVPEEERKRRWNFLDQCPRTHEEGEFLYVHASPHDPLREYVFPEDIYNTRKMERIFELLTRHCFHGHTHIPGIITEDCRYTSPENVDYVYRLDKRKTLCNVGSVGQPLDGDSRACYVLLDGEHVRFRRVEYDIETTLRKVAANPDIVNFLDNSTGQNLSEEEWLGDRHPEAMLDFLSSPRNERKLRLFACACCRRIWHLLSDSRSRKAIETLEEFTDGRSATHELLNLRVAAHQASREYVGPTARLAAEAASAALATRLVAENVVEAVARAISSLSAQSSDSRGEAYSAEHRAEADLLRHIVGNPFRPFPAPATWPAAVVQLAEAQNAGADCAFALHDALLEAGQPELAAHFREPRHPKGCWVVDLLLGKS